MDKAKPTARQLMVANTMRVTSLWPSRLLDLWRGFATNWLFLTIIPLPKTESSGESAGASLLDVRFFPVVGWILGIPAAGIYLFADFVGLTPLLCALLALGFQGAATGMIHEDGLGDVADSLGGRSPEQRLEILRDSRIGAYGTSALLFAVLLRLAALTALGSKDAWLAAAVLTTAGAVSRAAMGFLARSLPNARPHGLGATLLQTPSRHDLAVGALLAILPGLFLVGFPFMGLGLLLIGAILTGFAIWARRFLGGRTGDVLGAGQLLAECGFFLAANIATANMH